MPRTKCNPFRRSYLISILFFSRLLAIGQPVTPEEDRDYDIEELTLPGGKLGNNVTKIVQGPYGFMWFGSRGGLHRYDGYEFITYRGDPADTVGETQSLTFPRVEDLYWDKDNFLWVATFGGGVYRFDPKEETFRQYSYYPDDSMSISHPQVFCIGEDSEGTLWFGTANGLCRFDRSSEKFKRYYMREGGSTALPSSNIRAIYLDRKDELWIGSGLTDLATDISSGGGLSRYQLASDDFVSYTYDEEDDQTLDGTQVRGMLEDSRGNFWVGTSKGLHLMNRDEGTFQRLKEDRDHESGLGQKTILNENVYALLQDRADGIWIGTIKNSDYRYHLLRYDPHKKQLQIYPVGSAYQLAEGADGAIWVAGGADGKVLRLTPKTKTFDLHQGSFVAQRLRESEFMSSLVPYDNYALNGPQQMAIDPIDGHRWFEFVVSILTNGKEESAVLVLADYDPEADKFEYHLVPEIDARWDHTAERPILPHGMFLDKEGRIWGSLRGKYVGVYCYDPVSKKTIHYRHDPTDPQSLTSNLVESILMDSRGEVWVATWTGGLNRINAETGEISHYHFSESPAFDCPIVVWEDDQYRIWSLGYLYSQEGYSFIDIIDPVRESREKILLASPGVFRGTYVVAQSPVTKQIVFASEGFGLGLYDGEGVTFLPLPDIFPFIGVKSIIADDEGRFWIGHNNHFLVIDRDLSTFYFRASSNQTTSYRSGFRGQNGRHLFFPNADGWYEIDPSQISIDSPDPSEVEVVDLYIAGERQMPATSDYLDRPIFLMEGVVLPGQAESFGFGFSDFSFNKQGRVGLEYRLFPHETDWRPGGSVPRANYWKVPVGAYSFQVRVAGANETTDSDLTVFTVTIVPPWWHTWWAYVFYLITGCAGVYVVHRFQKRRVIRQERERAKDRELAQAKEVEKAYTQLQDTQTQLIHAEKMASLGELTAGIAHEIQNPLNFVNNFSEINEELIQDLQAAVAGGNQEDVEAILKDLKVNESKVVHHGKRAEEIVKSMLQHSRGSDGVKEPTDINLLVEEYVRLVYHGNSAKHHAFSVNLELDLDPGITRVKIVPQEIGRVLLNLINNALQAVEGVQNPSLRLRTRQLSEAIAISISDNGLGIPASIREKIFQPFFTTRPAGSGTGLGLSLSYDIIVKGHQGRIEVVSKEGEGTEFVLTLPA